MTLPDHTTTIGGVDILVSFRLDEAALRRDLQRVEDKITLKPLVRYEVDTRAFEVAAKTVRVAQDAQLRADAEASRARSAASQAEREATRQGQQLLRDRSATLALNARLAAQARREEADAARAAAQLLREQQRQEREAADAARAAHAQGMARLRERLQTEQLNERLRRDAERQAALDARDALRRERERQQGLRDVIEGLNNEQVASRALWQAGKLHGADLVAAQQDLRRRALEAADALDTQGAAYRRLAVIARNAQADTDSATGRVTPGSLAANVRTGIQQSGLFQQIAGAGALGSAAQNLGIVAASFTNAKTAAVGFSGATNTAATAAGILAAGAGTLALGLGAAGAGLASLARTGLEQVGTLQAGLNVLKSNGVQDVTAFQASVTTLKDSLGLVGQALPTAALVASAADIVKAGTTASEALTVLGTSSKLAAAEAVPLNEASAQLLKNTRQYGLSITEVGKVGDYIAKAGNLAAGSANDLSVGLGIVGTTGKQAGIELYDLLGMLVRLDNQGMDAADVGANGLRTAIASLGDPTEKARTILSDLGVALDDSVTGKARPAGDILFDLSQKMRGLGITFNATTGELEGNGEALRTVSGLMDTRAAAAVLGLAEGWRDLGQDIRNSSGYLDEYANQQLQGVVPAQERLTTALKDSGLAFAKTFAGPLADFLDQTLTPAVRGLGELFDRLQQIKGLGDVKVALKVTAADSDTAVILKTLAAGLAGTITLTGQAVTPAQGQKTVFQALADYLRALSVSDLQRQLQERGLIDRKPYALGGGAQAIEIARNRDHYETLLADALAKNSAALQAILPKLTLPGATGAPLAPFNFAGGTPGGLDGIDLSNPTVRATFAKTGNVMADTVAQWCLRWTKLTLEQANPAAKGAIERWMGGLRSANAARDRFAAAQVLHKDLSRMKPGDVVVYDNNHIGIYVGKSADGTPMVRGNNDWGWRSGRDVVSTEKLSSLGRVAGFVTLNDLTRASSSAGTPQANDGTALVQLRQQIAEGHRLLNGYRAALNSGNEVWEAKAGAAVRAFLKDHQDAAVSLQDDLQRIQGEARRARDRTQAARPSPYGQGYDRLKHQLTDAETDHTFTDDARAYARALDEVATSAKRAADQERVRNGSTEKARALSALAADAASRARATRDALTREADQADRDEEARARTREANRAALDKALLEGRLADARTRLEQLKVEQAEELSLAQDSASKRAAILKATGPQIVAAEQQIANLHRDQKVKDAGRVAAEALKVTGADLRAIEATRKESVRQAYVEAAAARAKSTRDQGNTELQAQRALAAEQQALRARYNAQARDLQVAEQQATLNRITELGRQELDAFRGTQTERIALIRRQAHDEYNAREQVARATRDKARAEAINAGGPNLPRTLALADQAYQDALLAASGARADANRRALEAQDQAVRAARNGYAQLAQAMRDKIAAGRVEDADLVAFQKDMQAAAREAVKAGVAGQRLVDGARASAQATYQLGIDAQLAAHAFDGVRDSTDRAAHAGQGYTVSLQRALELIPGSTEANAAYLKTLQDLAALGRVPADVVQSITTAIADQEVIARLTADQIARLSAAATRRAEGLGGRGDPADLDALTEGLQAVTDAAGQTVDATDDINALIDAINALGETRGFDTFIASLTGTVDDQIAQLVDRLALDIDPERIQALLRDKLQDLRSRLPAFVPAPTPGQGPAPASDGASVQTIAQARDLQVQLELTTDPAQVQGVIADITALLASEAGQKLTEGTRAGLQAAVQDAQTYLDALASITEQGVKDGFERAQPPTPAGAPPAPLDVPAATLEAKIAALEARQATLAEQAGAGQDVVEELDGVTDALNRLYHAREQLNRGPAPDLSMPAGPVNEYDALIDRLYALGDALKDPEQFTALTESLQSARAAGALTSEQLRNLLSLAQDLADFTVPGPVTVALADVQERVQALTDDFDASRITAQDFTDGLALAGEDLTALADQADRFGNGKLATAIRQYAASLRALSPEVARAAQHLGRTQDIAAYVQQGAQALGALASALGDTEQAYDRFTGRKLQTPWTDLAANLSGVANAAGKLVSLLGDVAAVVANPADIGAWVRLVTNVVSSVAEAIAGFQKARAAVQAVQDDFAADNPLLNPSDYQKAFVRSRGFFADVFGGGPEVVNEIDKIGLNFAKTMQAAFTSGVKSGLTEALAKNDFSLFRDRLHEEVFGGLVSGLVDVFLNDTLLKDIVAPAIKAWSDALKTPDPNDDAAALAGIDAAVGQVEGLADRFYTDVAPKLASIQDRFGLAGGSATTAPRDLFGASPTLLAGVPRLDVTFRPDDLRGLTDLRDQVVPQMLAGFSDFRLMVGEFRSALASRSGPQPLSGLGGLV